MSAQKKSDINTSDIRHRYCRYEPLSTQKKSAMTKSDIRHIFYL